MFRRQRPDHVLHRAQIVRMNDRREGCTDQLVRVESQDLAARRRNVELSARQGGADDDVGGMARQQAQLVFLDQPPQLDQQQRAKDDDSARRGYGQRQGRDRDEVPGDLPRGQQDDGQLAKASRQGAEQDQIVKA
jgi:hypothetical protein